MIIKIEEKTNTKKNQNLTKYEHKYFMEMQISVPVFEGVEMYLFIFFLSVRLFRICSSHVDCSIRNNNRHNNAIEAAHAMYIFINIMQTVWNPAQFQR